MIKDDIENGITVRAFCLKYGLSESTYRKYKRIILGDDRKIPFNITDEMQNDLKNRIGCSEYMKKYSVSMDTYYNHRKRIIPDIEKEHITLDDVITDEMKADLLNGITGKDYIKKYNCTLDTYYTHRKHIMPDDSERLKNRYNFGKNNRKRGITDEMRKDLLNGMSERDFILKYDFSQRTYEKYRKKVFEEQSNIIELF